MKNSRSLAAFCRKSAVIWLAAFPLHFVSAQIPMSIEIYSQNFDALPGSSAGWTNNVTLPGWYAAKSSADSTNILAGTGSGTTGGLYSFGVAGVHPVTERALGSLASGSADPVTYGIRFTNDTGLVVTNILISFTGEQWRNGGSGAASALTFACGVSSSPITNAIDAAGWTNFPALDFVTPTIGSSAGALDGNVPTNRQNFSGVSLAGVSVAPGQELFLRWNDENDPGNDSALAIDDLTISFETAGMASNPPVILSEPADAMAYVGGTALFSVTASGAGPLSYQWHSNNIPVPDATNDILTLAGVTTNMSGSTFFVTVSNAFGATNSGAATLTVIPAARYGWPASACVTYLTYNVNGNGSADWSTNTPQVQAIGRQLLYWQPDIIAFNEIPKTNTWQMANWVTAFMPGYYLATNSATDGYIRNAIASRWPIVRSKSWLSNSSLTNFDYNGRYPRDLFEAEIAVPDFPAHLHVFVAHLKATDNSTPQDDADERAAQCRAITNFLATVFLPGTNGLHPYILSGDLNESALFPETNKYVSGQPIQILTSDPTGLRYTDPVNSITHTDLTESIRGPLDTRFDYIFPCTLLFSNIVGSEVFRTDLLTNLPPNLFANDDQVASDHLPVLMAFANPFTQPFRLTSIARSSPAVQLAWQAVPAGAYRVEASTNLLDWTALATNLVTTNYSGVFATNTPEAWKFFRVRTE